VTREPSVNQTFSTRTGVLLASLIGPGGYTHKFIQVYIRQLAVGTSLNSMAHMFKDIAALPNQAYELRAGSVLIPDGVYRTIAGSR
jgi:hypothetical protein